MTALDHPKLRYASFSGLVKSNSTAVSIISSTARVIGGREFRMTKNAENDATNFEREKWTEDCKFRDREINIKNRKLDLKVREERRSRWLNPLAIAIFSAAVVGAVNILQNYLTAGAQLNLETQKAKWARESEDIKAEADRILQAIKTNNDPDKAAANLEFLVNSGLIANPNIRESIKTYIQKRKPGQGVALPAAIGQAIQSTLPLGIP